MPSTKILNISKTDTFEEVFGAVQAAEAKEVILIIPRGSKLGKQAGYFEAFSKEAGSSAKLISVMTEDPKIEQLAEEHGLHLLASPKKAKSVQKATFRVAQPDSLTDSIPEAEAELALAEDEEPQATLTMASHKPRRNMQDIIAEDLDSPIRVKADNKSKDIEIKKDLEAFAKTSREHQVEDIWAEKRRESKPRPHRQWGRNSLMKKLVTGFLGLVLVVASVVYFVPANAKIVLETRKDSVDFRLNVIASPNLSGVNIEASRIPGQKFSVNKQVSDNFPISGQKEVAQKAHGMITIFNNNIGQPQRLVATTRFESTGGLVFRIPRTLNVPGATKGGDGKINPGSIQSEVYADRPGPDYNIKPSSFKIPGFKGLPQYDQFSAVSTAAMSGGVIGPAKIVTGEDFAKAQSQLEQKLKEQIRSSIKDQIADMVLIEQGTGLQLDAPVVNAKVGEAAETLNMSISGQSVVVAFRELDLDQLIASYLGKKNNLGLIHSQLKRDYEQASYDAKTAQLSFVVHVSGSAAAAVNEQKIIGDIAGFKESELKSYFGNLKEITSAKVVMSPFWVSHVPKQANKIKLAVN